MVSDEKKKCQTVSNLTLANAQPMQRSFDVAAVQDLEGDGFRRLEIPLASASTRRRLHVGKGAHGRKDETKRKKTKTRQDKSGRDKINQDEKRLIKIRKRQIKIKKRQIKTR